MNKRFEIVGLNYQIAPDELLIYQQEGRIFSFPDGGHGHGYAWVVSTDVDFETTSLIFAGDVVIFKEFLPIKHEYISSIKVIQQSIGYGNNYTTILSPLENAIYNKYTNGVIERVDIKGYTYIGQMLFKNEAGRLFFWAIGGRNMHEITIEVDEASLQHVFSNSYVGSFYTDKNGLYYFPMHYGQQQQLESSNGKLIHAILHDRYFVYGDVAYPYGNNIYEKDKKAMRMNTNELKFIVFNNSYLADNDKMFSLPSSYTTSITSASLDDIIQQGKPQEPLNEWNWFDFFVVGSDNLKDNIVYYPTKGMNMSGAAHYLIKTASGFYGINRNNVSEVIKYNNVKIYNIETDDYEPIELEHFRRLTDNFYIYKNQMYGWLSQPVETEIDIKNLRAISMGGRDTYFYTDGTFLFGNITRVEQRDGKEWLIFEEQFRDVDWESLQVVSENVMIDKNNIYQFNHRFEIIPIKDLKINVTVIPNL
jgi:hypothetical protein